jgi:hypothetical protein
LGRHQQNPPAFVSILAKKYLAHWIKMAWSLLHTYIVGTYVKYLVHWIKMARSLLPTYKCICEIFSALNKNDFKTYIHSVYICAYVFNCYLHMCTYIDTFWSRS